MLVETAIQEFEANAPDLVRCVHVVRIFLHAKRKEAEESGGQFYSYRSGNTTVASANVEAGDIGTAKCDNYTCTCVAEQG